MGQIYILPKPGEREEDMPLWMRQHNAEQRQQEALKHSQDDKRSQDNAGYKQ